MSLTNLRRWSNATRMLLIVDGLYSLVLCIANVDALSEISRLMDAGVERFPSTEIPPHVPLSNLSAAVTIALIISWCIWQHRTHKALRASISFPMRFTPGWAVGWWFVPFANLFQPFRVMREAVIAGEEPPAVSNRILGWWWATLLSPIVLGIPTIIGFFADVTFLPDGRLILSLSWAYQARITGVVSSLVTIVAVALAFVIVGAVTERTVRIVDTFVPSRPDLASGHRVDPI